MTGSMLKVELVWELADMFNGLMVIPNIIAVIGLYKLIIKAVNDYENRYLVGQEPIYGPSESLTGRLAKVEARRRHSHKARRNKNQELTH